MIWFYHEQKNSIHPEIATFVRYYLRRYCKDSDYFHNTSCQQQFHFLTHKLTGTPEQTDSRFVSYGTNFSFATNLAIF